MIEFVRGGSRKVVSLKDVLEKPMEEWTHTHKRGVAKCLGVYRRNFLLKLKGYEESFAGRYGWECTDMQKRFKIYGAHYGQTYGFYVVGDENPNSPFNSLGRVRGSRNMKISKQRNRTRKYQAMSPILNFDYEFEVWGEGKRTELSVIITAYDQHDLTIVHVGECMKSTRIPDEIIVVNDGGTPDLREKLKVLPRNTKIIYARINEDVPWNYTGARNLGIWLSRGDYISIEDTDHIPHRKFYESALEIFKNQ